MNGPDLAIVGSGPAGMSAALEAAAHGLSVTVYDDQPSPGGMLYHNVTGHRSGKEGIFDGDYWQGAELAGRFQAAHGITYRPNHAVLNVDRGGLVTVRSAAGVVTTAPKRVLLATGATERGVPFDGWTLPGVMTAGAMQMLLKGAGLRPDGRTVLAGSGPLLLLAALQLHRAGTRVTGILETRRSVPALRRAATYASALRGYDSLAKGMRMLLELRRAGIRILSGVRQLRATGENRVEAVEAVHHGKTLRWPAELLVVHFGVVPNDLLANVARTAQTWHPAHGWSVEHDVWGATSVESLAVAGDGAGILGGAAALISGRLAGLDAACRGGRLDTASRDALALPLQRALARHRGSRFFIDALYPAPRWLDWANDATMVCRCEAVTVGDIRAAVASGCNGTNQVKAVTRCGMGNCQGRQCGTALTQLVAAELGQPIEAVAPHRARPPIGMVTMAEMAAARREPAA